MKVDQEFLKQAIEVGNQNAKPYNFGAVVVKDGKVIAAERSAVHENHNPSLHAEVCAIVTACMKLETHQIDGAVLYASHEPCVMCFCCAAWAHINRIVYCTPASKQQEIMYEFKDIRLEELASHLLRPLVVEQIRM